MVAAAKNKKTTTRRKRPAEKPHFFKILLSDFARRLKLPPRFVGDHLKGASDGAVVRDVDGSAWDVALEMTANGAFLSGGWAEFVEDHALKEHEVVVFRYDGNMHFTVVLTFDKADVLSGERCQESCLCPKEEEEDLKGSFDVGRSPEISPKKVAVPRRNKSNSEVRQSGGCISRQRRSRKETVKDGTHFSFCSTYPYFISRMNARELVNTRVLRLPAGFSRAHLPSTKTFMELCCSDGNVWTVNYIPSQRGASFCGGWIAFTRGSNLQFGDYCVFELVGPVEFIVTVIRADEVTSIQENSDHPCDLKD